MISPALSLLMKHLVIVKRQKTPNFSAFHWSPHGSLVSKADLITSYCSYAQPAKPGPIRTRLCGPCIAAIAGFSSAGSTWDAKMI